MILKRRVALNGEQLDELDNRILITGIDEAAGKDNISAVSTGAGNGQRVTLKRRDTLDVTVKFTMNIRSDNMAAREELLEKIIGWANRTAWMEIGHRPGRRLMVIPAQLPGSGDMFNWVNEFTMVFRAYTVPFWEDTEAASVSSGTSASGSMVLDVPGNAETVAEFRVENKSGAAINDLRLTAGGKTMTFSNLNMGGTATLVIDHVRTGSINYFRAMIGSTSVMAKRSGANDFTVSPGQNTVTWTASRAVKVTASVRGRYA